MNKYIILCIFVLCSIQNTHASDWIAYKDQTSISTQTTRSEIIYNQIHTNPQTTINNYVLTYSLVPVYTYQPVVINRQGIFCNRSEVLQVPIVTWIYHPTIMYTNFYYR